MNIIVYSKPNCPACVSLKAELAKENKEYEEIIVGVDITREEFLRRFPYVRSMPYMTMTT